MWNDNEITIKSLYGMAKPDPKYMRDRMKKIAKIIESMGNKYCLSKLVEKKQ